MKIKEKKIKRISFLTGFGLLMVVIMLIGIYRNEIRTNAAEYEDIGEYNSRTGGMSKVGIRITLDGEVIGYAYDIWTKNQNDKWNFLTTEYNTKYIDNYSTGMEGKRFKISYDKFKSAIPEKCTVTLKKYEGGECISTQSEYTYNEGTELLDYSLLNMKYSTQKSDLYLCSYNSESTSYIYEIVSAEKIGVNERIKVSSTYGEMLGTGEAYYDSELDKYVIKSMPQVNDFSDEENDYDFVGWYIKKDGFEQFVTEGDSISRDDIIYAKWNKKPKKFTVTFIDKIKNDNSEEILGKKLEQINYGEVVYASDYMGDDTTVNAYYEGRRYTGKEDQIVVSDDESKNIVCRYFSNETYEVKVVDMIKDGTSEGIKLGETAIKKEYSEKVRGSEVGGDSIPGKYYKGYEYYDCSEIVVPLNGGTVYRFFKPISYRIDFDGNGATSGEMNFDTEYNYGVLYALPFNRYIKESRITLNKNASDAVLDLSVLNIENEFEGWSKVREGDVVYKDSDSFINMRSEYGTEQLYAKWKSKEVSINVVPKRKGYIFAGWSEIENADAGVKKFNINGNKELYAVWVPDRQEYTVKLYKEEADGSYSLAESKVYKGEIEDVIKFADISISKDKYPGYFLNEVKSDKEIRIKNDGTAVLNVYYDRCPCVINYMGYINGKESVIATKSAVSGGEYVLPQILDNIKNPYRYVDEKGKVYKAGDKINVSDNLKIYPQFLVSYNDKIFTDTYLNYGQSVKLQGIKKTGYNFEGWYSDKELKNYIGTSQETISNITSNITLFAKWSAPLEYNITYNLNNSGVVILTGDVKSYKYMDRVVLPVESQMIIPEGWKFEGWTYEGEETVITEIKAGEYGDKKLCIVLKKKDQVTEKDNTGDKKQEETTGNKNESAGNESNNSSGGEQESGNSSKPSKENSGAAGSKSDKGQENKKDSKNDNKSSNKSSVVKKGAKFTINNINYIVTKSDGSKREVQVTGMKKSLKNVIIPDTVTIKKKKYKVVSIKDKAFDKCKSIKTVSIGSNIIKIGKEAFYKSANIKTVTIKSKIMKSIGKNAFSGIKCVIKINSKSKSLKKVYKTVLSNKKIKVKKY